MDAQQTHVLLEKNLVKKKINQWSLLMDKHDQGVSKVLRKTRWWQKWPREPGFMEIITTEVQRGMIVFDLGANIGYISLLFAQLVGENGHVYAVEPGPQNFQLLVKNIALNHYTDRITPFQLAISNKNGTAKFYLSEESNLHKLTPSYRTKAVIDVAVSTIDHFFRDKPFPKFMKMDVEGAEVEIFQGMLKTLQKVETGTKILFEVHPLAYSPERSLEEQLRRLIDAGFHAKYIISAGVAAPDFFVERGYVPEKIHHFGAWSRGIYRDVSDDDMILATCYPHRQAVKLPLRSCLKRPWSIRNRTVYSSKIVRALMLEK